jgi:hypothetical protein
MYLVLIERFNLIAVGLDISLLLLTQLLQALLQLGLVLLSKAPV